MNGTLALTLCLTHDCTLRCRYCYAGSKYAHAMTQETAELGMETGLAEAIRTKRGLDISFFGGEPLLEWELLQHCCDYTARRAAELKVQVRYGITTNGTLLTPERLPHGSNSAGGYNWLSFCVTNKCKAVNTHKKKGLVQYMLRQGKMKDAL